MYKGCEGVRCEARFERSAAKCGEVEGTTPAGARDSSATLTRRPREEGSDWRALKASMSSLEAVACAY